MPKADVSHQALRRLTHFLVAKSMIEALLVGGLAGSFYLTAFNPFFRGAVDEASAQHVAGWALNEAELQRRVEVLLYIDGRFEAARVADLPRRGVKGAGRAADESHGFLFETPQLPAGEHTASVYAVHESGGGKRRTLQLIGKPIRFSVGASPAESPNR